MNDKSPDIPTSPETKLAAEPFDYLTWYNEIDLYRRNQMEFDLLERRLATLTGVAQTASCELNTVGFVDEAFEYPMALDFLTAETVENQLAAVKGRLTALQSRMDQIEVSTLNYRPRTVTEAQDMLAFLAGVLTQGKKADTDVLIEVFSRCAHCIEAATQKDTDLDMPKPRLH